MSRERKLGQNVNVGTDEKENETLAAKESQHEREDQEKDRRKDL